MGERRSSWQMCRNKKMVREVCLKTLKSMSYEIKKGKKKERNKGEHEH